MGKSDGKHGDVQILPALAVTRNGLPLDGTSWWVSFAIKDAELLSPTVQSAPEQVLGKRGAHRDVRIVGDSRIEADEEKIGSAEAGDGLRGVVTNLKGIGVVELFSRYRQLWQVRRVFGSPNMIRARARSSIGSSGGSARIWPCPL